MLQYSSCFGCITLTHASSKLSASASPRKPPTTQSPWSTNACIHTSYFFIEFRVPFQRLHLDERLYRDDLPSREVLRNVLASRLNRVADHVFDLPVDHRPRRSDFPEQRDCNIHVPPGPGRPGSQRLFSSTLAASTSPPASTNGPSRCRCRLMAGTASRSSSRSIPSRHLFIASCRASVVPCAWHRALVPRQPRWGQFRGRWPAPPSHSCRNRGDK